MSSPVHADIASSSESEEDVLEGESDASESGDEDGKKAKTSLHEAAEAEGIDSMNELSFQELLALREKIGSKAFDKKFLQRAKEDYETQKDEKPTVSNKPKKNFKRENKNRPHEMSSRRWGWRSCRTVSQKAETRDPRFDDLCGSKFNEEVFDRRYSFLSGVREKEKNFLVKKLKKSQDPEEKGNVKYLLNRMKNQEREKSRKMEEKEVVGEWMKEERKKVKEGKKPYFLKAADKKRLIKEHRTKKLKESGKLDKAIDRKKKKLSMKQKKKLPTQKRNEIE